MKSYKRGEIPEIEIVKCCVLCFGYKPKEKRQKRGTLRKGSAVLIESCKAVQSTVPLWSLLSRVPHGCIVDEGQGVFISPHKVT